ncbi:transcription regulator [Psychrobacillus phage PVJ1]|nr:transcription regulator [Psychrobacillus phage PVJ1]
MSERQKEIYEYIKSFILENKYSPSIREIGEAVGLKSPATVHHHLDKMRENGYIDFASALPRTLSIVS